MVHPPLLLPRLRTRGEKAMAAAEIDFLLLLHILLVPLLGHNFKIQ